MFRSLLNKLFGLRKKEQEPVEQAFDPALLEEVEVAPGVLLPKVLVPYWPQLAEGKRNFIRIKAVPDEELSIRQSKLFHYPCMPKGAAYPVDGQGRFMLPLAQINFRECPRLAGFPETGYLQFYIANDDSYGLNFDDQMDQSGFRVLYFPEAAVTDPQEDFSFLAETMKGEFSPVHKAHLLSFQHTVEYISMEDIHAERRIDAATAEVYGMYPQLEDTLDEKLYDRFSTIGHKLGGYAGFTQYDPRKNNTDWSDHILLFQLDSDDHIMWGDIGVANFFIHPDDLARLDFDAVVYNWDCC